MTTPKTRTINGVTGQLFQDGERPIYLLPDGMFGMEEMGLWKKYTTAKGAQKAAKKEVKSIKLFSVDDVSVSRSREVHRVEASDMLENRFKDKNGKRVWKGYGAWYLDDDEDRIKKLLDLEERRARVEKGFNDEFDAIMKGAKRVYRSNFKDFLEGNIDEAQEEETT